MKSITVLRSTLSTELVQIQKRLKARRKQRCCDAVGEVGGTYDKEGRLTRGRGEKRGAAICRNQEVRRDETSRRESKTLCNASVICNYTDSYWPVGTMLHKNCVEKAEVYITKDGIVQEKSFSASCY